MPLMKRKVKMAVQPPSFRPTLAGNHHAVATGHYLGTAAAMRILDAGGNAVDAGVCASITLAMLQPDMVSFAGVAPTLIYMRKEDRVVSLAGLGYWPSATDIERLRREGGDHVPEGLLRTVVPAAPATHIEALRRYGTISFEQAATAAMEIARDGFAVYPLLASNIEYTAEKFRRWPDNARVFLPRGKTPKVGEILKQEDLARTIFGMIEAERAARGDRDRKLRAVHDHFYRGPIAERIDEYHREHGGFMTKADLAGFEVPVEDSISVRYRDYVVHGCDVWCQGIVLLQTLKLLEGHDLRAVGHNSVDYVHVIDQALNLAFADREAYSGDPKFVKVPRAGLLADAYAAKQRRRIDMQRAFPELPEPGDPEGAPEPYRLHPKARAGERGAGVRALQPGTIYGCVIDREGNGYSATISDPQYDTPIIPGTGLAISSRGCQSRLTPGHPSIVAPGKRPRLTPNPAMAFRDGRLFMTFGTPGGDVQSQAMLQVFLNIVDFGMPVQQAVEAPRFSSWNFPNSFAPHAYHPARLNVENTFPSPTVEALKSRGHDIDIWPQFPGENAGVCAVMVHPQTQQRHAGADPRREGYAGAW
jgi:gamma-glutamyltranspeptidase / glutathione hydrolase